MVDSGYGGSARDSLCSTSAMSTPPRKLSGGTPPRKYSGNTPPRKISLAGIGTPPRKISICYNLDDLQDYDSVTCCFICLEPFNKTVLLECQHMFCEPCLQLYYNIYRNVQYEQLGIFVPCPTCRKLTKVPTNGLKNLVLDEDSQVNRLRKISLATEPGLQRCDVCVHKSQLEGADVYCTKCMLNLCDGCHRTHDQQSVFKPHTVIHISNKEILNLTCEKHSNMVSIYFCGDCNEPGCAVCIMQEHVGHHLAKLRDALSTRRESMKEMLNTFVPCLERMGQKVKKLSYMHSLHSKKNSNSHLAPGEALSSTRAGSPNGFLESLTLQNELSTMDAHLRTYTYHIERLHKLLALATKTLEMSHSKKLLFVYGDLMARIQTAQEVELKQLQADIEPKLEREMLIFAELTHSNSSVNSLQEQQGNTFSSTDDSSLDDPILDQCQSSMLVKPTMQWSIEHQRNDAGELWNPCDVTFLSDNRVVVAEYDNANDKNNRLHFFDQVGKPCGTIVQGQIKPLGIAVTRDGNIALTDCDTKRVKVFTPSGHLMTEIGKGQFGWPYGIAVNSKGNLIVSDAFHDFIAIYQADGRKIKQFGSSGAGSSQFRNPYYITVDKDDNILVSDSGNNCIKVFDAQGNYMFRTSESRHKGPDVSMGMSCKKRGLKAPRGICTDLKGHILVADDRSRVCLFDSAGKYIRNLLTEDDKVKYPEALAMSSRGQLAVTEWNPNNMYSIKVFDLYQ